MATPEFACCALEALASSRHTILAAVTAPDKPAGRGHKLTVCQAKLTAQALDIPIYQPIKLHDKKFLAAMEAFRPDLFVVIAFRILPPVLFDLPKKGSINIHGSLLPRYRGAAPIQHALLNGDTETGLTSFFLTKKVDQGNVIHRVKTAIGPDENYTSLYSRMAQMSGKFLLETLDKIEDPEFEPQSQDDSQASPAPKIYPEQGEIDWTTLRDKIHNLIRAFSLRPGAFSFLNDKIVKILGSTREGTAGVPVAEPGRLFIYQKRLFAACGDGPLRLTCLQPEGRTQMDDRSFINGYMAGTTAQFINQRKGVKKEH